MRFETVEDIKRQERAVRVFCDEYEYSYVSSHEWAKIDYQIIGSNLGRVCGFEVKGCKNQNIGDKQNVLVSMRKLVDGQQYQKNFDIPLVMCWSFEDGILYERLDNLIGTFSVGGRKPRFGSTFDVELMTYIKQENLKKLLFI